MFPPSEGFASRYADIEVGERCGRKEEGDGRSIRGSTPRRQKREGHVLDPKMIPEKVTGEAETTGGRLVEVADKPTVPDSVPAPQGAMGRPPREELSAQQLAGIHALLTKPTIVAAAEEIDVHPRTISRWMKERSFRAEYQGQVRELQAEVWRQMLSVRNEVWTRYLELMRSNDEKVALRATTWFLEKVLSVPPMVGQFSLEDDDLYPHATASLRTFLVKADAVEHGNEDDAA